MTCRLDKALIEHTLIEQSGIYSNRAVTFTVTEQWLILAYNMFSENLTLLYYVN